MGELYQLHKGEATLSDLKDGVNAYLVGAHTVFHVDATNPDASDGNEGTDSAAPLKTIAKAYALAEADKGDVILIKGADYRYRENELVVLKDGLRFIGAGWGTEWNHTSSTSGDYVLKVEAKNVVVANLQISVNDVGSGIYIGDGAADKNASLCMVENCFIRGDWFTSGGPGAGILKGVEIDGAALATIRNCHIWGWGTGIDVTDGGDRTAYGTHIYDNYIIGCKSYGIRFYSGMYGRPSIVAGNTIADFSSTVNLTYAISIATGEGGVLVANNIVGAANPFYDDGDLNYWVGNFVRKAEAESELVSVRTVAHDDVTQ